MVEDIEVKENEEVLSDDVSVSENGPKYFLDIEDTIYPWSEPTITTEQIAEIGGWDPAIGVIEVDKDG